MTSIPYTTEDAVRARFVELGQHFDLLRDALKAKTPDVDIEIDSSKLFLAVTSYYIDIAQYKWWHFPDEPEKALIDGTKKAAYLVYWLNKLSPVYARRKPGAAPQLDRSGSPGDPSLMANLYFSIFVAFTFLDFVLSDELTSKLLYHMLWRDESPKQYMLLFEMLDAALKGNALFTQKPA